MRPLCTVLRLAAFSSLLALSSCSKGVFSPLIYLSVTVTPRPSSIAAGSTIVLDASVTNNLSLPTWSVLDAANTSSPGTLAPVSGKPNSISYTAPAQPPIYTGVPAAFTQGTVTIQASVAPPPSSTSLPNGTDSVTMVVTYPTVSVGLSPSAVRVPLSSSVSQVQYFAAYAVGSVNNALTYQVNGVTGGSTTTGTISTQGIYTAPSALPMTGNTVTLTVISQADPTKTASAIITLF